MKNAVSRPRAPPSFLYDTNISHYQYRQFINVVIFCICEAKFPALHGYLILSASPIHKRRIFLHFTRKEFSIMKNVVSRPRAPPALLHYTNISHYPHCQFINVVIFCICEAKFSALHGYFILFALPIHKHSYFLHFTRKEFSIMKNAVSRPRAPPALLHYTDI